MAAPVVLSRRGLLARVFIGTWLLALVATAIARTVFDPVVGREARPAPTGVELPETLNGGPDVSPGMPTDRLSRAL